MKIVDKKKEQREYFSSLRKDLHDKGNNAPKNLLENFRDFILFQESKIIASFISIKTEISTDNINEFILSKNKILCLPVIDLNTNQLVFKEYNSKTKLSKGKYGILEPDNSKKNLIPDIILTPCLSFDNKGFRLGYGGGYYDKTFFLLKKNNYKFVSIAVAFDEQRANEVIHDDFDQRIDYILTEKNLYKV